MDKQAQTPPQQPQDPALQALFYLASLGLEYAKTLPGPVWGPVEREVLLAKQVVEARLTRPVEVTGLTLPERSALNDDHA